MTELSKWAPVLNKFLLQAISGEDLKVSSYPKDWEGLMTKVSKAVSL